MLTFNSNRKMRFKHQWELLLCCVLGAITGVSLSLSLSLSLSRSLSVTHTHTHTHTQVIGAVFNKLVASLAAYRPKQADTMVLGESDERSWAETWRELLRLLRQHSFRIGEVVAVSVLTSSVTFGLPWIGA
eukprot:COSAG03_NODE_1926_length_3349_cov_16.360308_6_plen_131_part_00